MELMQRQRRREALVRAPQYEAMGFESHALAEPWQPPRDIPAAWSVIVIRISEESLRAAKDCSRRPMIGKSLRVAEKAFLVLCGLFLVSPSHSSFAFVNSTLTAKVHPN
ncbi:MAG TPA: hypothetical protein VFB50_07665, partial [Chloroflexota bacterium]|nr:hypothetical protein [Chloroflexota bacterium]